MQYHGSGYIPTRYDTMALGVVRGEGGAMTIEFRYVRPEEARERAWSGRAGFGDSTADADIDAWLGRGWWADAGHALAAFDGGRVAAQVITAPLAMRWNGADVPFGAVTAVSTLPTHRRRGLLRELMARSFAEMRDAGEPVAMLWASMAAIYQRFGYGIGYRMGEAEFDPRFLRPVHPMPVPGDVRLLRPDEAAPVLVPAYERFAAPRTLMFQRTSTWWERRLITVPGRPPPMVAVYEEEGAALGYVVYDVEEAPADPSLPPQRLVARELVWNTPAAHRALVSYLCGYDLARTVSITRMPADDPLPLVVQEPRTLNIRVGDGTLVRIVDVRAALEARGYNHDGRLRFQMVDPMCAWNDGVWDLSVEGGRATVRPSNEEPDFVLTRAALAMLCTGHASATRLVLAGLIPAAAPSVVDTADRMFHTTRAPLCADHF